MATNEFQLVKGAVFVYRRKTHLLGGSVLQYFCVQFYGNYNHDDEDDDDDLMSREGGTGCFLGWRKYLPIGHYLSAVSLIIIIVIITTS